MIVDKIEINDDEKSINDNSDIYLPKTINNESKIKIEKVNIIYNNIIIK